MADTLFDEQVGVASVAIDDKLRLVEHFVQVFATLDASFYNLYVHVFGHYLYRTDSRASATHNHYILHIDIVLFSCEFTYIRYVFFSRHEVSKVFLFQRFVTIGNDSFVPALDGYNVVRVVGAAYLPEWFV